MNHLIAEIRQRGKGVKTYKIFSDEEVYILPNDLDNPKVYNPDYKLEEDEWFHIPKFSNETYCIALLKKDFLSTDYDQINTGQLKKLKYLCSVQKNNGTDYYHFQKITPSQIIKKSWFKLSDAPTLEKESPVILINTIADAIYKKSEDTLYFRNLPAISAIFNGISELYKEATQEETKDFLNNDFIKLDDDYNADKVGKANRKRIALAMETLKDFSHKEKSVIYTYIKDYCNNLPFDNKNSNFTVKNEEDLKQLLWGIEQRYYTTLVGKEKRVANSVSKIEL
jgi:hypothetical protein